MNVVKDKRHHFLALDLLRGVAAVAVLFLHWLEGNGNEWFHNGLLAVDFFFLLSGFVMAYSYTERLREGMSFADFLVLRLIRLYPLILLGIVFGFLRFAMRTLATHDETMTIPWLLIKALQNVFMIPNFEGGLNTDMFILNLALWSLFFEFIAYILFALCLYRLKDHWLLAIVAISGVGVWAWLFQEYGPVKYTLPLLSFEKLGYVSGLSRVLFSFTLGILVFRLYQRHPLKISVNGWVCGLLLFLFMALPKSVCSPNAAFIFVALCFPLLICLTASAHIPDRSIGMARWLGDLSYPLYAVHTPIIWLAGGVFKMLPFGRDLPNIWFGAVTIPTAIVVGYLSLKVYDEPIRAYLTSIYRRSRQRAVKQA